MSPQAFNHVHAATHNAHTGAQRHNHTKTAQKPFSRQRRKQFTDLHTKLLGGRENTVLEVRAEVDAHLLLGNRRTTVS